MSIESLLVVLAVAGLVMVCTCGEAVADGGPLWEEVDPGDVPDIWRELSNETVVYPMRATHLAKRIGAERQLFLDNDLIASAENITREVHEPVRYEGNPVMQAGPRDWVCALHVLQFDESPRFRMWYWSMPSWYLWEGRGDLIRNGTSYAVSEDGINWGRPDLGLYEPIQVTPQGGRKGGFTHRNVVMPYGYMSGLYYEPDEPDPNRRFKAIVAMSAMKPNEDGSYSKQSAITSGSYVHWSPDGIHWQSDLSRPVIPAGTGYGFPKHGIGDTSRFWWDPINEKYIGDVKWVLAPKRRCRGIMESDDLVHWTRPRPTFDGREPHHGHNALGVNG